MSNPLYPAQSSRLQDQPAHPSVVPFPVSSVQKINEIGSSHMYNKPSTFIPVTPSYPAPNSSFPTVVKMPPNGKPPFPNVNHCYSPPLFEAPEKRNPPFPNVVRVPPNQNFLFPQPVTPLNSPNLVQKFVPIPPHPTDQRTKQLYPANHKQNY